MGLSAKQRAFIDAYLQCRNAAESARRAGYSEHTARQQGQRLLTKVDIAEEIERRTKESAMGADEVLARLAEQARNEHGQYISANGVVNLRRLIADGKGHLIKGTKETRWGTTVEFYSAQSALELIGKTHKLFTDKVEHSGETVMRVLYGDEGTDDPAAETASKTE